MAKFTKKTIILGTGLSVAGILATSLAIAAMKHGKHHGEHGNHGDHDGHGYHSGYHKGGKHAHMMRLQKLDADNDEAISLIEFQAPSMQAFGKLDTNEDGMISTEEFLARANERFAKYDADESGIIESGEFPQKRKWRKNTES